MSGSVESTGAGGRKGSDLWLSLQVAGQSFAIPVRRVREVVGSTALESVEGGPDRVCGTVVSQRQPIPVVDLRRCFDLPASEEGSGGIAVVRSGQHWIGLAADGVSDLLRIPRRRIQPLPPEATTSRSQHFAGAALVGEEWFFLLDVDRLMVRS